MGSFDLLLEAQRECVATLAVVAPLHGLSTRERLDGLLEALRLHLQWAQEQLQPLVARVEGDARASQQSELLLTMHELLAELGLFPRQSLEWQARLLALEDTATAHLGVERQLYARLDEVLEEEEAAALLRRLVATREGLWLRMRLDRISYRQSLSGSFSEHGGS